MQDVIERKERERHFEFMLRELSHRSKNLLAVIQAITHQTVRGAGSPAEFEKAILGRLRALAASHDLLLKEDYRPFYIAATAFGDSNVMIDLYICSPHPPGAANRTPHQKQH